MVDLSFVLRDATYADLPGLHATVERAYRGDSARGGWTHEADLVEGPRTTAATLASLVADPDELLLAAFDGAMVAGCVQVTRIAPDAAYLGLLTVDPAVQTGGLGKRLIAAAEHAAADRFGATRMELSVVAQRVELIAFYQRRGYRPTGERRPFPVRVEPPLELIVLESALLPDGQRPTTLSATASATLMPSIAADRIPPA